MEVELIYFKSSGKYYSEGQYETNREHMFQIFDEVKEMRDQGKLPGLRDGSRGYHILVTVPEHPQEYPGLIPL
ncbi:MAG TPA: hypothetical protein VGE45_01080 [Chloroflexia bacterium]